MRRERLDENFKQTYWSYRSPTGNSDRSHDWSRLQRAQTHFDSVCWSAREHFAVWFDCASVFGVQSSSCVAGACNGRWCALTNRWESLDSNQHTRPMHYRDWIDRLLWYSFDWICIQWSTANWRENVCVLLLFAFEPINWFVSLTFDVRALWMS